MTRTRCFDGTLDVIMMHCILSLCIVLYHRKEEPAIAPLFCHCERSKAIFLS
ncbi:MAG: hypothetical protein U0586_07100 [Candidatus Brocadiaceae bacterium]